MTRPELDELIAAAVAATTSGVDPASDDYRAAQEEAQILEAEASSYADAVDRDGKRLDYGAAVYLEGDRGVVVVSAADYDRNPGYWRTVSGRVDRITDGTALIPALQAAAARGHTRHI